LNKRHTRASRRLLLASGTATAGTCVFASTAARRRERVAHVWVMIYHPASHGRCRFVGRSGKLMRPRSCRRPVEFRAAGTSHWHLRLRIRLAAGTYLIRSDAVDGNRRHQPHTAASVTRIRVR
jgi:hypothetical protein